jgi:hypothetical protein
MEEGAKLRIYDPKVTEEQVQLDLSLDKFAWDAPGNTFKRGCGLLSTLYVLMCTGCFRDVSASTCLR